MALVSTFDTNAARLHRPAAGHARPADSADAPIRPDAWLGHLRADPADLPGRPPGESGLAVSGAPPPRAPRLDPRRLGRLRTRAPRALLPADGERTASARRRDRGLGAPRRRDRARAEA